ncbi:HdeA/HdeB family chaperone [Sulfitobacter sp. PS-8MA]|uniref:HdeA/HdeB family chaperone n=1 Tax=Sulfitobacter sp. PS-8MA TaxID=3237707 RepID=UPI0034C6BAF8
MKTTLKTLAIAGLLGTVSAPAFAAAHLDMATMTCAQYKTLSDEDKMEVASMAIAELEDGGHGGSLITETKNDGSEPSDISQAEATDAEETEDSLIDNTKAVEDSEEADEMADTEMTQQMEDFAVVCAQNPDALVSEAAAGMRGKE